MGVYPAAIELNRNGFDLPALLSQPGFTDGGPNAHATSLGTWAIAITIAVFGDLQTALPFLHIANFALAGTVAAGVYRISRRWAPALTSAMTALAAVLYPPLLAQATDIYLELALGAAIVWAVTFALEGRLNHAIAWTTIGILIKATGLIALPVVLSGAPNGSWRFRKATLLVVLAAAASATASLGSGSMARRPGISFDDLLGNLIRSRSYSSAIPDFWVLGVAALVLALLLERKQRGTPPQRAITLAGARIFGLYVFFIILSPLVSTGIPSLPRYSVALAALLVAAVVAGSSALLSRPLRWNSTAAVFALPLLLSIGFSLNMYGSLYPPSENASVLAERSLDYQRLLAIQTRSLGRFAQLAESMPSYYDHFTHYRLTYPEMGWVGGPAINGSRLSSIGLEGVPFIANMPERFTMLVQERWLGGDVLASIMHQAERDERRTVTTETFTSSQYEIVVVIVETS